ncbi:hypothetical protein BT69DRAFT_1277013, partial [Atractiella rhizophila]
MAKDSGWNADHWKKMLQHQEYNKEVMITKFNSIDRRIMELLRLLKSDQDKESAGNNASGSGRGSGVDSAGRAEGRLL